MFYLLHGEDEFSSREHLKRLRREGNFDYNQATYNGGEGDLGTIIATCDTYPFLTEQRLVIVEGLPKKRRGAASADGEQEEQAPADPPAPTAAAIVGKKGGKGKKGKKGGKSGVDTRSRAVFEKELAAYVSSLPETAVLVVLVDEVLDTSSPLLKAAQAHGKEIKSLLPKGTTLESWIVKRAKSSGAAISPDAAALLANFIGSQLRLLANELDKLAAYVGPGATIRVEDVRILSAQVQETRIFDLTDALAQRNRTQALDILHDLLANGQPPLMLISLITSQVRSLLLVKELAQKGMRVPQIASTIGMAPFLAEKILRQVHKFSMPQLEDAYRQLLAADAALKRSRLTPEMALDLLVVNFGNG
ncbi:MAG: DNA polymerase III subunit delta [Ktedonobacteraceae bacterium]|nr:DNA polymerase III subunit delta [Chloroflexota bacterium]